MRIRSGSTPFSFRLFLRAIWGLVSLPLFVGCGYMSADLSWYSELSKLTTVSGTAPMFASASSASLSQSVVSCNAATESVTVSLHKILEDGTISETALSSGAVDSAGKFELTNVDSKEINIASSGGNYILKASGCDMEFFKPLTDTKEQEVSYASTVISLTTKVSDAGKVALSSLTKAQIAELEAELKALSGSSLSQFTNALIADVALTKRFQDTFNLQPSKLKTLPPSRWSLVAPLQIIEGATSSYSVTVNHWNADYVPAYQWLLDGVEVSTASTYALTTDKNSQGAKTLILKVGTASAGAIDSSLPVREQTFSVVVADTFPATAPALTLIGAMKRNFLSTQVSLNTGASNINCATFDRLALTESSVIPPLGLVSNFPITCATAGAQLESLTITSGDGSRNLALWAMDAAGNVSSTPSQVSFVLDQTNPTATLTNLNAAIRGGVAQSVNFVSSDATAGVSSAKLFFAQDGTTFSEIADVTSTSSPYSWAVPSVNSGASRLRLTVTDQAGNIASATSNPFEIDAINPSIAISTPVANTRAQNGVTITGSCETGLTVTISGTGASANQTGPCTSGNFSVAMTFSANEGAKDFTVTQTDPAGNVGTDQRSFIKDTTPPALTITSPAINTAAKNGVYLTGACEYSATYAAQNTLSLGGAGLSSPSSTTCNSGGGFAVPVIFSGTDGVKNIVITQTDQAGNVASPNRNFVKDSAAVSLAVSAPANNSSVKGTFTINGICDSSVGAQNVAITQNAGTTLTGSPISVACVSGFFTQSVTVTNGEGAISVRVSQSDASSTVTNIDLTLTKDTLVPLLTQTSITQNPKHANANITFGGACETGLPVVVSGAENASVTCTASAWSFTTNRSIQGDYAYSFVQTDLAGNNSATVSGQWKLDTVLPVVDWSNPAIGYSDKSQIIAMGSCENGLPVTFGGAGLLSSFTSGWVCAGSSFTQTLFFSDGEGDKVISIAQTDLAGNVSLVKTRTFKKDNLAPPLVQNAQPSTKYSNADSLIYGGTCESGLDVVISGTDNATTPCNGSWSYTTLARTGNQTYNYTFKQTDAAGNLTELSAQFIRDAIAPNLTRSTGNPIINAADSASWSGTCDSTALGSGSIAITGPAPVPSSIPCVGNAWSFTDNSSTNGTRAFSLIQTDVAGNNSATVSLSWTRDTSIPNIQLSAGQSASIKNASTSATWSGTCQAGLDLVITGSDSQSITCPSGTWSYTPPAQTTDGSRSYTVTQTNAIPLSSSITLTWVRDTVAPQLTVGSFTLNSGATVTSSRTAQVAFQASDSASQISHFCIKTTAGSAPANPPISDSCWTPVNAPIPGLTLSQSLNLSNFAQPLDFLDGNYTVYAWVRDEVGNLSELSNSGVGTVGTDKNSITLDQGTPPSITGFFASNSNSTYPPLLASDEFIPASQDVFIKWIVSDNQPIPNDGVRIYFTTDDVSWTLLTSSGLPNSEGAGCSVVAPFTGCMVWSSPLSTYMRFRIEVTDSTSKIATNVSNLINTTPIRIIAGDTNTGLNGDAKNGLFFTDKLISSSHPYAQLFVVDRKGDVYFSDHRRGLLKISASTGQISLLLRNTASSTGDGGPISNATSRYIWKVALDNQDRLIIYDYDRFRRINTNLPAPTIEAFIGGSGSITSDTVANPLQMATGLGITTNNSFDVIARMPLIVSPSGLVYFRSDWTGYGPRYVNNSTIRLRVYRSDLNPPRIESLYLGGTGVPGALTQNLGECGFQWVGLGFSATGQMNYLYGNAARSNLSGYANACTGSTNDGWAISFEPTTGVRSGGSPAFPNFPVAGPNARALRSQPLTARSGKIYLVDRTVGQIFRFNYDPTLLTGGDTTLVLGNGTRDFCADGTIVTSCGFDLASVFIDENDRIFIFDHDLIRTVDATNRIRTIAGVRLNDWSTKLATNFRFPGLHAVDVDPSTTPATLVAVDGANNHVFRIAVEGNASNMAGGLFSSWPNTSTAASSQGFVSLPEEAQKPIVDPTTGDVFLIGPDAQPSRIVKSTGLWQKVFGTGATPFTTGDGLVGSSVSTGPVAPLAKWNTGSVLGRASNGRILMSYDTITWTNQIIQGAFFKLYDSADLFRQSHLAGIAEERSWSGGDANFIASFCANGTSVDACRVPAVGGGVTSRAYFDDTDQKWLVTKFGRANVVVLPLGGNKSEITLPHTIRSFVYRRSGGQEILYYCRSDNGRIHKQVIGGSNTALTWPNPSMTCVGSQMALDSTRGVLIFPFSLNGLTGLAETFEL